MIEVCYGNAWSVSLFRYHFAWKSWVYPALKNDLKLRMVYQIWEISCLALGVNLNMSKVSYPVSWMIQFVGKLLGNKNLFLNLPSLKLTANVLENRQRASEGNKSSSRLAIDFQERLLFVSGRVSIFEGVPRPTKNPVSWVHSNNRPCAAKTWEKSVVVLRFYCFFVQKKVL